MKKIKAKELILLFLIGLLSVIIPVRAISFEAIYSDDYSIDAKGILIDYKSDAFKYPEITKKGILFSLPEIKDHNKITQKGYPELPYKDFIIAVPLDSEPSISVIQLEGDLYKIKCSIPPAASFSLNEDGSSRYVLEPDNKIYSSDEYFPTNPYEVIEMGLFRDLRLVKIKLYPLMWNPVSGTMWVNSRISIRIDYQSENFDKNSLAANYTPDPYFDGINKSLILNYSQAARWSKRENEKFLDPDEWNPIGMLKIVIDHAGFYKVQGSNLVKKGFDLSTIDPSKLGIYYMGKQIASKLKVSGDSFAESDYIEFYGESIDTKYTGDNVYWLSFNESNPMRITTLDASSVGGGNLVETHFPSIKFEKNNGYKQVIPDGDKIDHWYWYRKIIGEQKVSLNLNLPNMTDSDYTGSITVRMMGETNITATKGHLVRVAVNGEVIGETTWYSITEHDFKGDVNQSTFVNGDNLVEIYLNPGKSDPNNIDPYDLDGINLNWVEFNVEQNLVATDNVLFFSNKDLGLRTFKLSGFTEENIQIFDITDPYKLIELTNFDVSNEDENYSCNFSYNIIDEVKFIAFTPSGYGKLKSTNLTSEVNLKAKDLGADYIMIASSEFVPTLAPLVQRYESQNMRVLVASTDQIYDQFEYGIFTPEGIRNFLRYTYYYYHKPSPSFVLLVGDANYDYRNYLNLNESKAKNYVPPYIFNLAGGCETPSDFLYTSVSGDDDIPDMAVGRLCVRAVEPLETILGKIENYSRANVSDYWNENVLFVSGQESNFKEASNNLLEYIPNDYNILKVYLGDYENESKAKSDLVKKINDGVLLLNYMGHSTTEYWANTFFTQSDLTLLDNIDKLSFWVLFNCLNGYFMDTSLTCFAKAILNYENGGVVACLAQSSANYPNLQQIYGKELYPILFGNKMQRMGLSALASNIKFGQYDRSMLDTTNSMVYFGDPALALRNDFGEDAGLKLVIETDKNDYYSNEMVNINLKIGNIGPDIESADIYAVVSWGEKYYFLPEGTFEPMKAGFFIPSGASHYFDQVSFDPVQCPSNTNINILSVVVKFGTTEIISNIASHSVLVNKIPN
ncbi:hypothetical protein KKB18_12895 [bacterium]|nr:hypothetical protein [bacterium]